MSNRLYCYFIETKLYALMLKIEIILKLLNFLQVPKLQLVLLQDQFWFRTFKTKII